MVTSKNNRWPRYLSPFIVLLFSTQLQAQQFPPCNEDPIYQYLDFWVGQWRVEDQNGEFQGDNLIEKTLKDCAVLEHWTGGSGSQGKSLFYVNEGSWHQVWVTEYARVPGGTKEKHQVKTFDDGGIRFQGKIKRDDGSEYLDRTTLRPMDQGRVHQLIEVSTDGGENWQATFDAIYIPTES